MAKEELATLPTRPMAAPALNAQAEIRKDPEQAADADDTDEPSEDENDRDDSPLKQNEPRKRRHRPISQKKQADYAAFDNWLEKHKDATTKADATKKDLRSDESKSSNWLMHEYESNKIIESPRDYQIELFERAKERNTIAVLDTGSGKTLIAALLLRHVLAKEFESRHEGNPKKVAFFVVSTARRFDYYVPVKYLLIIIQVDKVALVFQQHAVLECNLDQPIAKFCGNMLDRSANAAYWGDIMDKHMIVVCTAAILLKCLYHSYIRMDQINLLIFDEAHHAKKNHPFAEIIKQFYINVEDKTQRPRVFGMTASPVDARTDVKRAATDLETLLHSEIATIRDPAALQKTICKPKNEVIDRYTRPANPTPTALSFRIRTLIGNRQYFKRHLHFEKQVSTEIGTWAVDRFWQLVFRDKEMARLEAEAERECISMNSYANHELLVEAVREAGKAVRENVFAPAGPGNLTAKVLQLHNTLRGHFLKKDGEKTRCIVFVEQRWTAMMLTDLLQTPEMKIVTLEPATLVRVISHIS